MAPEVAEKKKSPAIEFVEELPPTRNRIPSEEYSEFAQNLTENPGRWAILFRAPKGKGNQAFSLAYAIKQGRKGFGKGKFEATVRQTNDQHTVFVRAI